MSGHESFWRYRGRRWLWVSVVLISASVLAYVTYHPPMGHGGGTWLGYTLGTVSFSLMLWLTWLGARKRAYHSTGAPLVGWTSAHVYLGLSLIVLVPLHAGFQLGWNVHTLAYLLVLAVVLSGMAGVWAYTVTPVRMTENRPGQALESLFQRIDDIDLESRNIATALPDSIALAVSHCIERTHLTVSLRSLLRSADPACPIEGAIRQIALDMRSLTPKLRDEGEKLLELLGAKRATVAQIRRDQRYKALLDSWLYVHVPLATTALAAAVAHVFIVLAYR